VTRTVNTSQTWRKLPRLRKVYKNQGRKSLL